MPTGDELLDLSQIGQRSSVIRFDVVDRYLSTIGTIQPDTNSEVTITLNINRTVKRDMSGMILNANVQADVDPFSDRIRPVWILENGDEYNLGVFLFASMDRVRHEWGLDAEVSAVDQTIILDQPIEKTVALAPGAALKPAIEQQFIQAGITSYSIDSSISGSVYTSIAWPAGTSRLQVINDMAAMSGAYSAFFDNDGVGRVIVIPDLATTEAEHVYSSGGRILADSMVETDDLLEAPNRYLVIDSSNPDRTIVGLYDVPDSASHSYANRGFRLTKVIEEQGLESTAAANKRAQAAYSQEHGTFQWVQFSSPPDPRHDTFDIVEYLGEKYREIGWSLPLAEGSEMTHDLRRVWT